MNIILCGFMGAGKTTVGRLLSEALGREFIDMDEYIVNSEQMSVNEIFKTKGEPYFRELETKTAGLLAGKDNLIIAVGGGTLLNPLNAEILGNTGIIFLLGISLYTAYKRLESCKNRPLLNVPDRREVIKDLYEKRTGIYRAVSHVVIDGNNDPEQAVQDIISHINHSAESKKILVVGLGLIGGSLAKALKKYTKHQILGLDKDEAVVLSALTDGCLDKAATEQDIKEADIILLCLYVEDNIEFVKRYADIIRKDTVIVDACGVKKMICDSLFPLAKEKGLCFIGGHPMAGKEKGGYKNSSADLFCGAGYILTPPDGTDKNILDELHKLFVSIGFKNTVITTPKNHDEIIAYTSQLPHVLACAYLFDSHALRHGGFSAGSFRDVSRVALINEEMWTGLFIANREALSGSIETLCNNLYALKEKIDKKDSDGLKEELKKARMIKERIG